jgi:opacity protein-like surface antigen
MKKTLILTSILLFCLSLAWGQVSYGIRAGLNSTNRDWSEDNDIDTGDRTGFHAGLIMQYRTDANFIVQPELLYTQKGFNYTIDLPLINDDVHEITLDYVELPLVLKYDFNLKGFHIQPLVAPQIGYAIKASHTSTLWDSDTDLIEKINKINYGVDLGLDLMIMNDFLIGARYQIGLADIGLTNYGNEDDHDKADEKLTHKGFMVSLGYIF